MLKRRIYIIGAGSIANSHVQTINKLPIDEVEVHVSDNNLVVLQQFKERFPWVIPYQDATSMLAEPAWENDFVIVCTPPVSHCSMTMQALESGRHVLCEKPLATNQEESLSMLAKAREMGRLLGCCSPRFIGHCVTETMKSWVQEQKFGRLYHVRWLYRGQGSRSGIVVGSDRSWCFDSKQSGGGVLMDWGPYDMTALNDILQPIQVDVLHAWMAPPVSDAVLPEGAVLNVEFHVGASMIYHCQDGSQVPVSFERGHPAYASSTKQFEFQGTEGAVELDWLDQDGLTYYYNDQGTVGVQRVPYVQDKNAPHMLERPLFYFFQTVNGQPSPAVLNEQAVFNFNCLRAVYDCVRNGRAQSVRLEDL